MMTELEVLKAVCDNLVYLGDHKYQKRVWISGLGPEVSSYEDSYEDFFGFDPKLLLAEASNELLASRSYEKIRAVISLLENFNDAPYRDEYGWVNPSKLLESQLWHKIQNECMKCAKIINEDFFQ